MKAEEIRRVVASIRAHLFKNANATAIGMLKSQFKGSGLMFKEHRVYTHGDDVRFIDWKLLAKNQIPYIKTFEEERNIEITVIIDATPSMLAGHKGVSKLQAAVDIACLLYLLAERTGDHIHILIVKDTIVDLPKCSGEEGIVRLIEALENNGIANNKGQIHYDIEGVKRIESNVLYAQLSRCLRRHGQLVFLSDFIDFLDPYHVGRFLRDKRTHCFRLISPLEELSRAPYRLLSTNDGKTLYWQINAKKRVNLPPAFGKRMRPIRLKDRYLETFVREMYRS